MRYYLLPVTLSLAKTALSIGVIESSLHRLAVASRSPSQGLGPGQIGTPILTVTLTAITAATDDDLGVTTLAKVQSGTDRHRQQADECFTRTRSK